MRSLVWAFVASFAIHTLILCIGLDYYDLYLPVWGFGLPPAAKAPNPDVQFGLDMAKGEAINMSPGLLPQVAPQADENQAWLTRHSPDATNMTHAAARPVMEIGDGGGGGSGFGSPSPQAQQAPRMTAQTPIKFVRAAPPQNHHQAPPQTAAQDHTDQGVNLQTAQKPQPPIPPAPSSAHTPAVAQPPPQPVVVATASNQSPGKPGQRTKSISIGDPQPGSNSDSDPFSTAPQVTFDLRDGRVDAQNGLTMKTVKPQLNETGWFDVMSMQNPTCKWALYLDSHGNPIKAVVIQPTGFNEEVDLPCEEALNQWQAVITNNARVMPHVVEITINFR